MLKLVNVKKVFNAGTVNAKVALDGVSLTVEDGEFATIIGSNGAGKSTLFNCIGGSFIVDEGSVYLDGTDRAALSGSDARDGSAYDNRRESGARLPAHGAQEKFRIFEDQQQGEGAFPRKAVPSGYGA